MLCSKRWAQNIKDTLVMENNETTVNLNGLGHRTLKTHREWKIMRQEAFTEHERHIIEDHESGFDHHGVGHKTLKNHEIS